MATIEDVAADPKEKVRHGKKGTRVPVWIKKETLQYRKELRRLQIELLKLQNHVKEKGLKLLLIFEGRDAAGKGGTIKRITEHINPRGARVVALEKPSDTEKTQWYFQRYTHYLPSAGEMVFLGREIVEAALASAPQVYEQTFRVHQVQQCPIEPHISIAWLDADERMVIRTATQVPLHSRVSS